MDNKQQHARTIAPCYPSAQLRIGRREHRAELPFHAAVGADQRLIKAAPYSPAALHTEVWLHHWLSHHFPL